MQNKLIRLIIFFAIFTGISSASAEKLQIITSNFPSFDIARTLCAEAADVSMLLPPGSESHSYEPTPQDLIAIQNADLFIYTGGESDHWIDELLASLDEDAPPVFRLSDCVSLLAEETSKSMQSEHTHHHEHDHNHNHSSEEIDEHVWTSPRNVQQISLSLANALGPSVVAPERLESYLAELDRLDEAFRNIVESGKRDCIIFGDRFPFRYFAAEYGLHYDAAFPGCSEDSEPSVRTVISLIDIVREEQIPVVFYIEFSSRRTADILCEETGATALLFHSCHNVSAEEIEAGASYLSLMWQNTEALKEALN